MKYLHSVNKIPLSPTMGLEIKDFQIRNINSKNYGSIYADLLKHKLLVFRNQSFTSAQMVNFARHFGKIQEYPFASGLPNQPEVVEIRKDPNQTKNFSGIWHTDSTYLESPPDFTLLTASETPLLGGDTAFSDTEAAFSTLSEGMKRFLLSVNAVNISDKHASTNRASHLSDFNTSSQKSRYEAIHPAVKVHEKTGRHSIYINQEHTERFEGMSIEESKPIIDYICAHIAKYEFTMRVKWEKNTLVVWDNRCLQHHAINDYNGQLRVMHRIIIQDTRELSASLLEVS